MIFRGRALQPGRKPDQTKAGQDHKTLCPAQEDRGVNADADGTVASRHSTAKSRATF
jgi:hypothetical protein